MIDKVDCTPTSRSCSVWASVHPACLIPNDHVLDMGCGLGGPVASILPHPSSTRRATLKRAGRGRCGWFAAGRC